MSETPNEVEVRRFSRALFGNRHKLEVLAAIAVGDRMFYVQAIAANTGIPSSTVRPVVKDLVDVVVRELPFVGHRNAAHYHERLEHPIWQMAVELLHDVRAGFPVPSIADD